MLEQLKLMLFGAAGGLLLFVAACTGSAKVDNPSSGDVAVECGGIRATLDAIGTEYFIVETAAGPACFDGSTVYVDVSCEEAHEFGGAAGLVEGGQLVYGCYE
jgi:hypothetical protein